MRSGKPFLEKVSPRTPLQKPLIWVYNMNDVNPKRKKIRLTHYEYNNIGAYFVTICTEGRKCILSEVIRNEYIDEQNDLSSADRQTFVGDGVLDVPPYPHDLSSADRQTFVGDGVLDVPPYRTYETKLTPFGEIADKYINQLNDFYDHISVEEYVIMPNHIHLLLMIRGTSRTPSPTVYGQHSSDNMETSCDNISNPKTDHTRQNSMISQFVSTFKRFSNKAYGQSIWQRSFYDHVVRNKKDYDRLVKYIYENPLNWVYDELYAKE